MTTYWCSWCGETREEHGPDLRVPCMRCVGEFLRLFGFWPETAMVPLAPGEEPGEPGAARKRFTFVDPASGAVIGMTQAVRPKVHRQAQ